MARKKPFLCKIGIHQTFYDSVGENLSTAEKPVVFFRTYIACNYCDYRRQIA